MIFCGYIKKTLEMANRTPWIVVIAIIGEGEPVFFRARTYFDARNTLWAVKRTWGAQAFNSELVFQLGNPYQYQRDMEISQFSQYKNEMLY